MTFNNFINFLFTMNNSTIITLYRSMSTGTYLIAGKHPQCTTLWSVVLLIDNFFSNLPLVDLGCINPLTPGLDVTLFKILLTKSVSHGTFLRNSKLTQHCQQECKCSCRNSYFHEVQICAFSLITFVYDS